MRQALTRKIEREPEDDSVKAFKDYSRRLLRDLEGKGIIRTSVETVNLAEHADDQDVLGAECVRTFPSVTFQAQLLLKRDRNQEAARCICHSCS